MIPRAIHEAVNRRVTRDELQEALERPISQAERDEAVMLHRWFTTRYPSAEERLAYVRQAYARWRGDLSRSS